jgi:Trk K+ transport system NAD-binding subunit
LKRTVAGLFVLAAIFAAILTIGYVDTVSDSMDLLDAVYFSIETLATVGYGDFAFDDQPGYLRVIAILVMICGTALMAILYALVTEFLVSRRIARTFGLPQAVTMTDHVIVVGLGSLGIAVVEHLIARGRPVVVIERNTVNRHIARARALGVPVIIQEATQPQTLQSANLNAARGVAVLTSDEYANIESGLAIRGALGDQTERVPIVMRVFDRRLGAMLEQRMRFRHVRSVSAVAAPWFVGAALGLKVMATFTVDQEAFIAGRLTVRAEGGLAGMSMLDLPVRARVMALTREGGLEHLPWGKTTLEAGDDAYVVGPPEDVLQLLIHNRTFASAG